MPVDSYRVIKCSTSVSSFINSFLISSSSLFVFLLIFFSIPSFTSLIKMCMVSYVCLCCTCSKKIDNTKRFRSLSFSCHFVQWLKTFPISQIQYPLANGRELFIIGQISRITQKTFLQLFVYFNCHAVFYCRADKECLWLKF